MLKVKAGVRPRSLVIAAAVSNAATELGLPDMLITSGNDSVHMVGSKHFTGDALDIRTKHLTDDQLTGLVRVVKRRLGPAYQVIIEKRTQAGEHGHIEYDPA